MAVRIQLKRTKGWRKPAGAVVVSRPSRYGNPFQIGMFVSNHGVLKTKADCVNVYRDWLVLMLSGSYGERPEQAVVMRKILRDLKGKDLACWCKPGEPCHADVLLEFANRDERSWRDCRSQGGVHHRVRIGSLLNTCKLTHPERLRVYL